VQAINLMDIFTLFTSIILADNAFLSATQNQYGEDVLRLTAVAFPLLTEPEDAQEWSDFSGAYLEQEENLSFQIPFQTNQNDDQIIAITERWVQTGASTFTINIISFIIDH
jgi:hypothetical protein